MTEFSLLLLNTSHLAVIVVCCHTIDNLQLTQCLGSPVLGYLAAGILIGPYGLSIIRHVHGTKAIAEFGVVFLLFNIGLEVRSPFLGNSSIYSTCHKRKHSRLKLYFVFEALC